MLTDEERQRQADAADRRFAAECLKQVRDEIAFAKWQKCPTPGRDHRGRFCRL